MSDGRGKTAPAAKRSAARILWILGVTSAVLLGRLWWSMSGMPVYGYRVVARYPHDPSAYTQGLLVHEGELFESTGGYGRSTLRVVDLESGEVLRSSSLPGASFGEGIAIVGDRLIQLTWQNHVARVCSLDRLEIVKSFNYEGEGWGLTTDGERLYMSDGTHELRVLDPETFEELNRLPVLQDGRIVEQLNELEWIEGEIWANVWKSEWIVRIDPETGAVVGWIDLSGIFDARAIDHEDAVLNGIAYDPDDERIFVTGKLWPWLFEIEVERKGSLGSPSE